jgi:OOP family OmpA-OmpF porin
MMILTESSCDNKHPVIYTLIKLLLFCGICLFFVSCSSKPKQSFGYHAMASPSKEIDLLQEEMQAAEKNQIEVFAPESYHHAQAGLEKAKKLQANQKSDEKILQELGNARSYFEHAKSVSNLSQKALPDIAEARRKAMLAGASHYNAKSLAKADKQLMKVTEDFENKTPSIKEGQKKELQSLYQSVERETVKEMRLGDVRDAISDSLHMGAEKYAPRTLASARDKLRKAEAEIDSDLRDEMTAVVAVAGARYEARKLVKVTGLSKSTGKPGNENLVLAIIDRDEKIARLRARDIQLQRMVSERDEKLESQTDEIYREVQKQFSPEDVVVYRQGNNLILRLKSLSFEAGKADIPASATATLSKVRSVIEYLNAPHVVVGGHADSTGSPDINRKLAGERAQAVAHFLGENPRQTGSSQPVAKIDARGFSSNRPVSSDDSEMGRALNRRVDIVISAPGGMN